MVMSYKLYEDAQYHEGPGQVTQYLSGVGTETQREPTEFAAFEEDLDFVDLAAMTHVDGKLKLMAVGGDDKRARSLAMAAVRETFEETGLLLARPGDVGPAASESWSVMRERGVAPALARLTYVGRAITPVRSPIRFHARFFVADARYSTGDLGGDSELVDLHWCPVKELADLPTIAVQSFMLTHAVAAMTGDTSGPAGKPLFTQRAGQRYIRYDKPRP